MAMTEKKRTGNWTITPLVPSISMQSKVYEIKIDPSDNEEYEPEKKLIIQWVNRHNFTIGVRFEECDEQLSLAETETSAPPSRDI